MAALGHHTDGLKTKSKHERTGFRFTTILVSYWPQTSVSHKFADGEVGPQDAFLAWTWAKYGTKDFE